MNYSPFHFNYIILLSGAAYPGAGSSGASSATDLNDQIAKDVLNELNHRLTPQFLQRLQQTASLNQSFQQNQLAILRSEAESKSRSETKIEANKGIPASLAQDLRQHDRNSLEYSNRGKLARPEEKNKVVENQALSSTNPATGIANNASAHMMQADDSVQRGRLQEFNNPYSAMSYKTEQAQRMLEFSAQYHRVEEGRRNNIHPQNISHPNRHPSYPSSEEMKSPLVNSPAGSLDVSPAHVQSPAMSQQISPANSQVSPAPQQFSPSQIPSASPQMSPYSQPSPNLSPYSQQSPKMSPYSQVSPAYPSHNAVQVTQQCASYPPQASPVASCALQQKSDTMVYSVPSYIQDKEVVNNSTVEGSASSDQTPEASEPNTKGNLRTATDSPRLDTPPGLAMPSYTDDSLGRHTLPLVPPPVSTRVEAATVPKTSNSSKFTSPTSSSSCVSSPSTVASNFFSSNAISGMASMTNKIKMLESKMQSSKSKSMIEKSIEDNSLKNWWKPQSDPHKKLPKPSLTAPSVSSTLKQEANSFESQSRTEVKESMDNNKAKVRALPLSSDEVELKSSNEESEERGKPDPLTLLSSPQEMEAKHIPAGVCKSKDGLQEKFENSSALSSEEKMTIPTPVSLRPHSPVVTLSGSAAKSSQQPVYNKKRQNSGSKTTPEPLSVPYESKSQRFAESYATPNFDRMEIKNSGIPGPSAVTWKRKSFDDSPSGSHQSKKENLINPFMTMTSINLMMKKKVQVLTCLQRKKRVQKVLCISTRVCS